MPEFLLDSPPEPLRPTGPPARAANAIAPFLVGHTVEEVERVLILETLAYCFGNRTLAAGVLGISVRTMRNKINRYTSSGLAVPEPQATPLCRRRSQTASSRSASNDRSAFDQPHRGSPVDVLFDALQTVSKGNSNERDDP